MKKVLAIILTVICGFLANTIAAVPSVWILLTSEKALGLIIGLLAGLLIACGLADLLNLIGKKLEGKCGLARWVFLLIAQAPFVVLFAALFITNAVRLHNFDDSVDYMFSGLDYWGLKLGFYMYLGALVTSAATTAAAFIALAISKKQEI